MTESEVGKRDTAASGKGRAKVTAKRAAKGRHDITSRAQQARPGPIQEWTKAMNMTAPSIFIRRGKSKGFSEASQLRDGWSGYWGC